MKRLVAILLTLAAVFALSACEKAPQPEPEEPDPHQKSEDALLFADFLQAQTGSEVIIEAFVQAAESLQNGRTNVYLQDRDGGYYVQGLSCTQEAYDALTAGAKMRVSGVKTEERGHVRVEAASFEMQEGEYVADAFDISALFESEELGRCQNMRVSLRGMSVDGAPAYRWDGSGTHGDDLYLRLERDGRAIVCLVDASLCAAGTEGYEAISKLKAGDVVDAEGFLFWYEGVLPCLTGVTPQ